MSFRPAECHGAGANETDLDWEDWDPNESSFVHHMIAGSFAGVAEHALMFPVDTIKTVIQCEGCVTPCVKQQVSRHDRDNIPPAIIDIFDITGFRLLRLVHNCVCAPLLLWLDEIGYPGDHAKLISISKPADPARRPLPAVARCEHHVHRLHPCTRGVFLGVGDLQIQVRTRS